MAEALLDLLVPYLDEGESEPSSDTADILNKYLRRLPTLSLSSLNTTENQSLSQSSHSTLLGIQSLSARSNAAIVTSSDRLSALRTVLPRLAEQAKSLRTEIPILDDDAVAFAEKYSRSAENEILERRKKALLMSRNVDRLSDILDLPALLSSAIASSTAQGTSNTNNYASALDLYSHIKRLHLLYQDSEIVSSIYAQTEEAMQGMTSNLITSLRTQNIKLAGGLRTIGWLRRVVPELDGPGYNSEGSLGALFLVCRLATLLNMLSALDPLRDLADQETTLRQRNTNGMLARESQDAWSGGQQTERYLKRYIEIFREQSFLITSMYRSIFPSTPDTASSIPAHYVPSKLKAPSSRDIQNSERNGQYGHTKQPRDPLNPPPSALATFPSHIVSLLMETLKEYLPNVRDKSSRESLLTQILYCAGSLGRLGGDFSLMLADVSAYDNDDEEDVEWVTVMKKHRILAGRLEKLASQGG